VTNELSFRTTRQAAFLAGLLAEVLHDSARVCDSDCIQKICDQAASLAYGGPSLDGGASERLELLAALTESAGLGQVGPAHRSLLAHLASCQPESLLVH
jgi:hypothetical protein